MALSKGTPKISMEWLEARCTRTECGCLVWKGYIGEKSNGGDYPYCRPSKDSNPMPVRRLVWKLKTGRDPAPKDRIGRKCDTWGCVEPECMERNGPADKLRGRKMPLDQRAKLAAAARALRRTDLDIEKVRAIRASSATNEVEAKKYNVGENTVAEIRRGTRWREYVANPWLQLQA